MTQLVCFSIRSGTETSKSVFSLKENRDTDYDDLRGCLHKSIVIKGAVEAEQ